MPRWRLRIALTAWVMVVLPWPGSADAALRNVLQDHPSPYLAMHGGDPVHWQVWGEAAFAAARREDKLLYVSIGYFSCHWCHVMQRESYQNVEIAARINEHFVPVKVDRELNPALDARLIEFVERTRGISGWPLNVFITPEGYPLLGIIYLPPEDFQGLLEKLASLWERDRAGLKANAQAAAQALQPPTMSAGAKLDDALGRQALEALEHAVLTQADELEGGFGSQNKFPSAPQLRALLVVYEHGGSERVGRFLRLTLDRMADLGLHDLLGGGFFRYTVDPTWRVPHFEKMLYDNALLANLYFEAADALNEPRYAEVARETLDFMLQWLRTAGGAFAASLSAIDAKGVEGGYYLWEEEELGAVLTEREHLAVRIAWGMGGSPTTEDGHLPVRELTAAELAGELKISERRAQGLLNSARKKLLEARARREVPRDDKKLAAWNGLVLSALVEGARRPGGDRYRAAAKEVRDYLLGRLWDGERLLRARTPGGKPLGDAALEDYAYVGAGLLDWAALSDTGADRAATRAVVDAAWRRFFDEQGWRMSETSLLAYGAGQPALADGPMPSPSGVLIEASLRLAAREEDETLRTRALRALNAGSGVLLTDPYWFATYARVVADY